MAMPRSARSVTTTADAGTASRIRTASAGTGERSVGKALRLLMSTAPMNCRPNRNSPAPTTSPNSEPSRASPAAIRRAMWLSAPTRRSAASRRSRRSPPKRTAVAMKMATGISRTTQPIRIRTIRTGSMPGDWIVHPYSEARLVPLSFRESWSLPA